MSGSKSSSPEKNEHPLELTVHGLPEPGQVADAQMRGGRIKMMLVLLVCAAPVIASYFTYYVIKPQGTKNYGELMMDLKPLPSTSARDLDGRAVPLESLRKQWLLVSVSGGACDATCEKHLYQQRQIREATGKEKERVDWVWLINDEVPVRAELLPALKQAVALRVKPEDFKNWIAPATGHQIHEQLYLVDPQGQWMMRFPAQADPYKVKADLERLLRASNSWDKAGR
ncbi:MAG: cytochrome oxidase assembly protein Sco1/SenC family [Pseudomonadota bacterium]|jgi:cytochrome oxidase Cu insertion factor (SCO1/SenC/PrrC family)